MRRIEEDLKQFIPEEKTPNEDRLIMLCDGVFAIAATLLVLDISINISQGRLSEATFIGNVNNALGSLVQPTISYLVTFFIIAMYWRIHRNLMRIVQRLDNGFILLTFLFLAFIAFFPVTSKLLGNYADDRVVVIIYTLGLSGCGFSAFALWLYATWKHRLVSPDLPQDEINTRAYTLLIIPLIYCASLLLLFVVPLYQPYLICFSWALIGIIARAIRRIYKHWLEKPTQVLIDSIETAIRRIYKRWPEKPAQPLIHHEYDGKNQRAPIVTPGKPEHASTYPEPTQASETGITEPIRVEQEEVKDL